MLPYATTPMLTNGVQHVKLFLGCWPRMKMIWVGIILLLLLMLKVETDALGIELKKHQCINVVKD